MSSSCNSIPSFTDGAWTCLCDCSRCCYHEHQWIVSSPDQVTDSTEDDTKDEQQLVVQTSSRKALKEKNIKKGGGKYVHVPHKDKPPQVVAKRNARERRRVQAVNGAFNRLRKAVPLENNRGKRVSKVRTLQNAIKYIQKLQELLHCRGAYQDYMYDAYSFGTVNDLFEENFDENFQFRHT